jgi:hypothetical protein
LASSTRRHSRTFRGESSVGIVRVSEQDEQRSSLFLAAQLQRISDRFAQASASSQQNIMPDASKVSDAPHREQQVCSKKMFS